MPGPMRLQARQESPAPSKAEPPAREAPSNLRRVPERRSWPLQFGPDLLDVGSQLFLGNLVLVGKSLQRTESRRDEMGLFPDVKLGRRFHGAHSNAKHSRLSTLLVYPIVAVRKLKLLTFQN